MYLIGANVSHVRTISRFTTISLVESVPMDNAVALRNTK